MNISACLFSASVLLFPFLISAQDTASVVPDSGQWFADTTSGGDQVSAAEHAASGAAPDPADTLVPADPGPCNTIVVTAARREQPSKWVSDDHTVINMDAERKRTSKSVSEIIASNIPAYLADNGGGTVKTVSLMGAGSQRTLVLVDGKRMGTTENDLGDLSPEIIEKIEVVEGSQSAQYGMDAVGGVVNIITKHAVSDKWSGHFSAIAGAYEPNDNRPHLSTQGYQLSIGKKTGNLESFTAADFDISDGAYEYASSGTLSRMRHNDFRDWGVYQKLGMSRGDVTLNAALSVRDRTTDNPGSLTMRGDITTKKNLGFAGIDAGWRVNDRVRLKADASVSLNNIRYEPASWNASNHQYLDGDVELVQDFTFGNQLVTTGVQGLRHSVISSEMGFRVAGQGGVFASAVFRRSMEYIDLRVAPALRFDYSSQFKGTPNGRLGLIATLLQFGKTEPSVFANAGSSSRSPTFIDLYWPYGGGNPNLKKETGFDADGGFQVRTSSGKVFISNRASMFFMRLRDMIVLDALWVPQNLDKATIAGFKFASQVRYSDVYDIAFNVACNSARNSSTGRILTYRPRFVATFSNRLSAQRLSAGFALRYSGEVFSDQANTYRLPAIVTADVNLGVMLVRLGADGNGLRLVYDVLNVTNEDRMAVDGYPLPRREHRLSLKAGF